MIIDGVKNFKLITLVRNVSNIDGKTVEHIGFSRLVPAMFTFQYFASFWHFLSHMHVKEILKITRTQAVCIVYVWGCAEILPIAKKWEHFPDRIWSWKFVLLFIVRHEKSPSGISFITSALDFHVLLGQTTRLKKMNSNEPERASIFATRPIRSE